MKKNCELCKGLARMHCESDQASLCLECDAKVHSANFLVARHFRNFLCHVCQSSSPWSTAGTKLRPVVFVCHQCVCGRGCNKEEAEEIIAPWSPPPPSENSSSDDEDLISKNRRRNNNASLNSSSDV